LLATPASPAPVVPAVHELARQEQQAMLDTLRDLVSIESGSKDVEGLDKIAALIADRLRQLGGKSPCCRRPTYSRWTTRRQRPARWCRPNGRVPARRRCC
jgi:glutamate carboxypeptidase